MTKDELLAQAKERGLEASSKMTKGELEQLLAEDDEPAPPSRKSAASR